MRYCKRVILTALSLFLLAGISGTRTWAADRPVLILADLSGSSQERLGYYQSPEKKVVVQVTRAEAIKEILTLFARNLPASYCPVGLFEVRYLSGDPNYCLPLAPVAAYQGSDLQARVNELATDVPVFNRRTPLADGLRQLDETVLKPLEGRAVILLISDGGENIRSGKNDANENQADRDDDPAKGPLNEVRRLKLAYGDKLAFHAVGLECGDPPNGEERKQEGLDLLRKMTAAADGRFLSGRELLENTKSIDELFPLLCSDTALLPK